MEIETGEGMKKTIRISHTLTIIYQNTNGGKNRSEEVLSSMFYLFVETSKKLVAEFAVEK